MSKGVKTVLAVAVAIAIPFAAPAIASSIGLSSAIAGAVGSATAGSVIGGAITGAALGGANAALFGDGNVGRGALVGGLSGGIGGYTSAPSAATSSGTGLTAPVASTGGSPYALGTTPSAATLTSPTGLSAAMQPVDYGLAAGAQFGGVGLNPATAGIGLQAADPGFFMSAADRALAAGTPIDYGLASGMPPSTGLSVTSAAPGGGTQVTTGQGAFTSTTPVSAYSGDALIPSSMTAGTAPVGTAPVASAGTAPVGTAPVASAGTAPVTPAGTKPTTFYEALTKVPAEIGAKFSDPKALADLTLRAAGQLAGSALAGDGLSNEERELLAAQTDELRTLQQENAGLFRQRLEQAQNLIGESKYFDPEYFGLQRARRAQVAGARAKRAGLRGLTGGAREAESRRFDLATGRDTGTAYDQGYGTGVAGRLQTMQAGLSGMPASYPSSASEYTNLRAAYGAASGRARERQQDIGNLFGDFTGSSSAKSRG